MTEQRTVPSEKPKEHDPVESPEVLLGIAVQLRQLADELDDHAVFLIDPSGTVASWNQGAERITGYRANEILGRHLSVLYTEEARARGRPAPELNQARTEGRFEDETRQVRKDGKWFAAKVVVQPLQDRDGRLLGFLEIIKDLTERRQLAALQAADRQKNDFLAVLAHELRNPLAPIMNGLQVIKQLEKHDTPIGKVRDIMERQIRHLARLLDDLHDLVRITHGKIELRKEAVDLATVIKDAVETCRPEIDSRKQKLEISLSTAPAIVSGDPARLKQVLTNLLNNASKHTKENGHISLSTESEAALVVIRVRDDGMGIAADLLPTIFEPFHQVRTEADYAQGGLAIGLNVVRRLVELHGGTVQALSGGRGQGSEFVLGLPIIKEPRLLNGIRAHETTPQASAAPAVPSKRRILIADDNVDAAKSLAMMLRLEGHEVRVAYDGPTALQMIETERAEMIFLDIKMPGMSGHEVARTVRNKLRMENAVLVALTGCGLQEDRRRSKEAGFDFHLVKPVEPAALQKLLRQQRS